MKNTKKGLSLLELVVVIIIIGVISAFVIPKLWGTTDTRKVEVMKNDVKNTLIKIKTKYLLEGNIVDSNNDGNLLDDMLLSGEINDVDYTVFNSPNDLTYEVRYIKEEGSISLRLVLETTDKLDKLTIERVIEDMGISENNFYSY